MLNFLPIIVLSGAILQTGQLECAYNPEKNWQRSGVNYKDEIYSDPNFSANGIVMLFADPVIGWAGGAHGNENVEEVYLIVDGIRVEPEEKTYKGEIITFVKQSVFGEKMRVLQTSVHHNKGIDESFTILPIDTVELQLIYLLETKSNELTSYVSFNRDREVFQTGQVIGDDLKYHLFPNYCNAILLFNPEKNKGIIARWESLTSAYSFIWDRPADNKIYARFSGVQDTEYPELFVTQTIRFVEVTKEIEGLLWQ